MAWFTTLLIRLSKVLCVLINFILVKVYQVPNELADD